MYLQQACSANGFLNGKTCQIAVKTITAMEEID
jgi:hypothetical protein